MCSSVVACRDCALCLLPGDSRARLKKKRSLPLLHYCSPARGRHSNGEEARSKGVEGGRDDNVKLFAVSVGILRKSNARQVIRTLPHLMGVCGKIKSVSIEIGVCVDVFSHFCAAEDALSIRKCS